MLKIELTKKNVELNLPTFIHEITKDYLNDVTYEVNVAENYSLIGLLYIEKLSTVIYSNKNRKALTTRVIPVFIKCGKNNSDFINSLSCGDTINVAPSDVELGHHINCSRNLITMSKITAMIEDDKAVMNNIIQYTEPVVFLEFKLIPNCNIHGSYKDCKDVMHAENPFVRTKKEGSN